MSGSPAPGEGPVRLGVRLGPLGLRVERSFVERLAAATAGPVPAGDAVPPAAFATAIWEVQRATRAQLVAPSLERAARTGVHGEHDVVLHRPVAAGEPLDVWVEAQGARPAGRNAVVTLRYTATDADGNPVVDQWWSTVYVGVTCPAVGAPPPDHAFPSAARAQRLGRRTLAVDADMARRYAEVSGDWSAHHFDADAARRAGHDRPFAHGLCTMALCARAVADLVADGDQGRLRRVAVRFVAPVPLGAGLDVDVHAVDGTSFAFEAHSAGAPVIAHGRAELW